MGEIIGELLLRPLFEFLLQLIGYITARVLLPILSFGFITVAPASKGVKVYPKWHGLHCVSNGKIVLHEEMGALLGIVIWLVIIALVFYLRG